MQILITRKLKKEISCFKQNLSKKEFHSSQEIMVYLDAMESKLSESFINTIDQTDKKLSESKNQLKKKNRTINELKSGHDKRQSQWIKERHEIKKESQKNKKKVQDLLRNVQKSETTFQISVQKLKENKIIQCQLQNQIQEQIFDSIKKQNSSLSLKIIQLQQIIRENNQDIEAANHLIQELIKQLETNTADKQSTTSSCYDFSSDSQKELSSDLQYSLKNELTDHGQHESEESANCAVTDPNQDCSTIDGSNATNKDFALPEWLQFETEEYTPRQHEEQLCQKSLKMWPQMIWNRMRQFVGLNYQI